MKKNGLSTPLVRATSIAAPVSATDPSTTNLAEPSAFDGRTSLTRMQERAGEREQDQDRLLRLGPQAGAEDDGGRDEDEHPADDPDDAVVGVGRRAVDQRVVQAAGHGGRRQPVLSVVPGARVVRRAGRGSRRSGIRMTPSTTRLPMSVAMTRARAPSIRSSYPGHPSGPEGTGALRCGLAPSSSVEPGQRVPYW